MLRASGFAAEKEQSPAVPSIENQYFKNVRQVTSDFTRAGEGYFSPDGKTIIFQAVPREYMFYQIYKQPLENGSKPTLVSTGRGRTTCSYFCPTVRLIFASSHLDPKVSETEAAQRRQDEEDARTGQRRRYQWDFDPWMEIFSADLDGRNLQRLRLRSSEYDAEGAYTPDGKQIVFCSDRGGNTESVRDGCRRLPCSAAHA